MTYRFISMIVIALSAFSSLATGDDAPLPNRHSLFFIVTAVNDEQLVIQRRPPPSKAVDVPDIVYKPAFKTLRATDARGKPLSAGDVARRVKPGMVVLVSPDEEPVDSAFLSVIKEDTVILIDVLPRKGATGAKVGS